MLLELLEREDLLRPQVVGARASLCLPRGARRGSKVFVVHSILSVEAAIAARHGWGATAIRLARGAVRMEESKLFQRVLAMLGELSPSELAAVVGGALADGRGELNDLLRELAEKHEVGAGGWHAGQGVTMHVGRISRIEAGTAFVTTEVEEPVSVPEPIARAAGRGRIGDCIGVIRAQVDEHELAVRALPGIAVEPEVSIPRSPFARSADGFERVSDADLAYLQRTPKPLTPRVPISFRA